jgi:hypothetical protein
MLYIYILVYANNQTRDELRSSLRTSPPFTYRLTEKFILVFIKARHWTLDSQPAHTSLNINCNKNEPLAHVYISKLGLP